MAGLVALAGGCDELTVPEYGALEVTATVTGQDPDPDGFTVTVEGRTRTLGIGGSVVFAVLEVGSYGVFLDGLVSNCSVPSQTRTVEVPKNDTARVDFPVTCVPREGSVEVSVATIGNDVPDGYRVAIGQDTMAVERDDVVTFAVPEGTARVQLLDVPSNCIVEGANPVVRQVEFGGSTSAAFDVKCYSPAGAVQVEVATLGNDVDRAYRVAVAGDTMDVGTNGTLLFQNVRLGAANVKLLDISPNCTVQGENPVAVSVAFLDTASVAFDVRCTDNRGALAVEVRSVGEDLDPDGYRVAVDGDTASIGADERIVFADLLAGTVQVELLDLTSNCRVENANPQSVAVVFQDTAEVEFSVACTTRTGAIEVDMNVVGDDADQAFLLAIDSDTSEIGWTDTRVFEGVPEGTALVQLLDVADNCTVTGENPRSLAVTWQDTVSTQFDVTCEARVGGVEVTTATTGEDLDPDGYQLVVGDTTTAIGLDETLAIAPVAEGSVTVTLQDVAPNCSVADENPRTLDVIYPDTTPTAFAIECVARLGAVQVDVATTGEDIDIDGYRVALNGDTASVGVNGSVVVDSLPEGDADIELLDVAGNCTVEEANPGTVTVAYRDTTATSFTVACQLGPLAYASDRDGDLEIYTMDADGGNRDKVTANFTVENIPTWSPDGASIAFQSDQSGNLEVFRVPAGGGTLTNLTNEDQHDQHPSWVGNRIAFTSRRDGNDEIWIMDADGSGAERLTRTDGGVTNGYPALSPDGSRVAFSSDRDGGFEIYILELGSGAIMQLTGGAGDKYFPAWSPDGTQVVYTSYETGGGDLYMKAADGETPPVRLTDDPADDATPSFSPGGTKIAFASRRDGDYEIYIMDPDGSNVQKITSNGGFDVFPAWRP